MIGRDRRYGSRQVSLKAKVGIATAVLVGGGAIGVAAATSSHSPSSASNAGYQYRVNSSASYLQNAVFARNTSTAFTNMARLNSFRTFSQMTMNRQTLAIQRGIVVLATKNFLIVKSANGSLHAWRVSGNTMFTNATTMSSTSALTANTFASQQAMVSNNMVPALNLLSNVNTFNSMVSPVARPTTVTVNIAGTGTTVTVTVVNNSATMTTTQGSSLTSRVLFNNLTASVRSAIARNAIARGDLVAVAGVRSGWWLQAKQVVFANVTSGTTLGTTNGTTVRVGVNSGSGDANGTTGNNAGYHS